MTETKPDTITQTIGVLLRRETEARILAPVIEALGAEFGRERVVEIVRDVIIGLAREQGAALAAEHGDGAVAFLETLQFWTRGGALEIELLGQGPERFDFDVTRCRYAEMYREMGLGGIGHLLSCGRDGAFVEGYDPEMKLERDQTIMSGASCCTFRYRRAPAGG